MNSKITEFYNLPPNNFHQFSAFDMVYGISRETERVDSFPCEVCNKTGKLTLKTRDLDGTLKDEIVDCWYCSGSGVRSETHSLWRVIGRCQVVNYEVSIFPNRHLPDTKGQPTHAYVRYRVLCPHGYRSYHVRDENMQPDELEEMSLKEGEIFASEEKALAEANRRNDLLRRGEKDS